MLLSVSDESLDSSCQYQLNPASRSSPGLFAVLQTFEEIARVEERPRNVNSHMADQVSDLGRSQIRRCLLDNAGSEQKRRHIQPELTQCAEESSDVGSSLLLTDR